MTWWKGKQKKERKVDVLKDIQAISEFLDNISVDTKVLLKELKKLEQLEKEYKVAKSGIIQINLETQAKIIETLLQRYDFFQSDADINGQRIKIIAKEFLKRASHHGLTDLVKEKKKDRKWSLRW